MLPWWSAASIAIAMQVAAVPLLLPAQPIEAGGPFTLHYCVCDGAQFNPLLLYVAVTIACLVACLWPDLWSLQLSTPPSITNCRPFDFFISRLTTRLIHYANIVKFKLFWKTCIDKARHNKWKKLSDILHRFLNKMSGHLESKKLNDI